MTEGVPLRPFLLSLRAEGVAIPAGHGIAELVPSLLRLRLATATSPRNDENSKVKEQTVK